MTSPPVIGSLHHVLMEVADLERSVRFYTEALGFTIRKEETFRDGRRLVVTHQGLGLVEGGSRVAGVMNHVCFSARGVDQIAARVEGLGFEIVRGPGDGPYGHTVYVRDPDGREVELFDDDDLEVS